MRGPRPGWIRFFRIALALVASLGAADAAGQEPPLLLGQTVVSVAYTSDGEVERSEVERLLEVAVGAKLTEAATGRTIRNLFETERFSDVEIEAQPVEGGVAVTVHLFRSFRVNPLKFSGRIRLSREELRRTLPFLQGSVLRAGEIEEGAAAVKRRLEEEGYLDARVSPEASFDRKTFDVEVLYRIESGQPARVAPAFFDGNTSPFSPEELQRNARLRPGDRYRESKARADAARMTEFLHRNSRLKGQVELIAAQPTENGRLMPVYRPFVGPKIVFEARGVKAKTVERQVYQLIGGQGFDEDLILRYVEEKRRQLQRKGHYRAKVDYSIAQSPDTDRVTITIDEGPHFEIEKIVFLGNDSVQDKKILALIVTHKKGLPFLRPGHLSEEDLAEDVSSILGYYQTHGWIGAKVGKPRITEGSKPSRLVVTIAIEEGPRVVVASRRIIGAEHIDLRELEKDLLVRVGEPFNPNLVRQDVSSLQSAYRNRGWREVSVREEFELSRDKSSAQIIYRIEEGPRSFFGKTIVRGNTRTDTGRVARLVAWEEGRPFSEDELLQTQRSLTRVGVFRRVTLTPQPPDPATQVRNIEVDLQEGRPLALLYGFGYQLAPDAATNRQDPFAIAGVSYNNLFGRMISVGLEAQFAPISRRGRFQANAREPFLFGRNLPLTILAFFAREPIQEIDIERRGAVVESSRDVGRFLRLGLRFEYQRIDPVNPEKLADIERKNFPRFDQPIAESTIGPNLFYDRRDDIIDPHDGYYVTSALKYAFPIQGLTRARYTKISGQGAYFWPLGRNVVAVAARAGGIFPYGPPDIQVPIAERFFAGGRSTNRAFDTDVLGIPGVTVDYDTRATPHVGTGPGSCAPRFPDLPGFDCDPGPRIIGGNGFLSFNAELRFPIVGDFGGTVFYDVAQVWKDFSQIRLTFEGRDGLRQGAGVGLRLMTPVGPIRAEYGWPVNPRTIPFNVTTTDPDGTTRLISRGTTTEKGRFLVSIGYPF